MKSIQSDRAQYRALLPRIYWRNHRQRRASRKRAAEICRLMNEAWSKCKSQCTVTIDPSIPVGEGGLNRLISDFTGDSEGKVSFRGVPVEFNKGFAIEEDMVIIDRDGKFWILR